MFNKLSTPNYIETYLLFCDILKITLKYMKIPQLYAANLSFYSWYFYLIFRDYLLVSCRIEAKTALTKIFKNMVI